MPLFKVQAEALAAISANRSPSSHIAGGIAINHVGQRFSKDIDIFHDFGRSANRAKLLEEVVAADAESLINAGFRIVWDTTRQELFRAVITKDSASTTLEWVIDSDFRFFPAIADDIFGYRLHTFDLATNKVLAAASRREPRDLVDLLTIDKSFVSLPAVIWAAPAKDPGYTPESLVEDIRRNGRYVQGDYERVWSEEQLDAGEISRTLKDLLRRAEDFAATMPPGFEGAAFLENGTPVQPDVLNLQKYEIIHAERQAHWPSSPEIESEMIASSYPRR